MKSKKIVFFGLFGQQNWGNECTLQAIIYSVRKYVPDVELSCICTDPSDTSARHNISAFPIRGTRGKVQPPQNNPVRKLFRRVFVKVPMELLHWVEAFKTLRGAKLLVAPGTGMLADYATSPFGWPYDMFKWTIVAKLRRCKILFVSVGAGPISHPLSKWFIKAALSLASYRSYRDVYSKEYLKAVGFDTERDRVYPDLAFSLPRHVIPECGDFSRQRPVIGVGLKDYYGEHGLRQRGEDDYCKYLEKTADFVTWLLANDHSVRVLMGDAVYDGRVKEDLIELLEKRGVNCNDGRVLDEPVSSVEQLLAQLASTDVVVSPRFHNIILALMLNKPVISLSYHEKFSSLMADMGLPEYCQHLDHLDIGKLSEQLKRLESNTTSLASYVKRRTEEHRGALDEQYSLILNDICDRPPRRGIRLVPRPSGTIG